MSRTVRRRTGWAVAAVAALALAGCGSGEPSNQPGPASQGTGRGDAVKPEEAAEIKAERDKLPAADRAAVDAQEWCAVNTKSRLGSMGPPVKVTVKDQAVYLCCDGCETKALANPDKTLASVADLKAKKAGQATP